MQENYTITKRISYHISIAIAYSKSIQVIDSTTLKKKFILINN